MVNTDNAVFHSAQVIRLSQIVVSELGLGYSESIYQQALGVELRLRDIPYVMERPVDILYRNERVGIGVIDILVHGVLPVELKIGEGITQGHKLQLRKYMKALNLDVGLLVMFPTIGELRYAELRQE